MSHVLTLPKFTIGVGDRFAHQARAQLKACIQAEAFGTTVIPVWNKSNREHTIIHSEPKDTRAAAEQAVHDLGWTRPYFVDADHIGLQTVERFLEPCDFFTLDVAESIGKRSDEASVAAFVKRHPELLGTIHLPGLARSFQIDRSLLERTAHTFLAAVKEAGAIYRHLIERKGKGTFVAEISMDETVSPQTSLELVIILAAIADQQIPVQTIAPKFTGRFNKGVDYVGDVAQFSKEFEEDIAALAFAVAQYGLPANLKLSVHSGSDKFSIYEPMHDLLVRTGAGVHVKTAGTTWLEELVGLAESDAEGLALAKEVYQQAFEHSAELCAPYATVIDIDTNKLPTPDEVKLWTGEQFVAALRHEPGSPEFNPSFRQLLHVGFKVAAKMGDRYLQALDRNEAVIARNVTTNLFDRHIKPIFIGRMQTSGQRTA